MWFHGILLAASVLGVIDSLWLVYAVGPWWIFWFAIAVCSSSIGANIVGLGRAFWVQQYDKTLE